MGRPELRAGDGGGETICMHTKVDNRRCRETDIMVGKQIFMDNF